MQKTLKIGIVFVALTALVSFSYKIFSKDDKSELLLEALSQVLEYHHYNPMSRDDAFSKKVYELYLEKIDFNKRYLIASDIKKLSEHELAIDDQIAIKSYEFFDLSLSIIHQRVEQAAGFYNEILTKPFDFKLDETAEFDAEKIEYAKNETELKEIWRKSLKYQVMTRLATAIEKQKNDSTNADKKSFEKLEKEARENVLKLHNKWFKRIRDLNEEDRRAEYLNAIAGVYDPHTEFYPPIAKEEFDIRMSGSYEGIGAVLQASEGYVKVVSIFPGSASWRQGELKAGDLILQVAQGEQEPVDILDMRLEDVVKLIKGKKETEVRLTIRKREGNEVVIPIVRDVVIMEETFAKSLIVRNKDNKNKVGYISLASFYTNLGSEKARSSSGDVESEILKLEKENVNGIIIDLRDNGGGSLGEVVKMAGLFIDKGAIVQIKTKHGKAQILADTDPRVQYDGKLIVLVNHFSASASEIFAAAIQDYKRGVIVGNPTWGKGTVQTILDFDDFLSSKLNDMKPLGALKLTVQKYYRINGHTTQLKGVIPDIILPDIYSELDMGEREYDNALSWDEIAAADYEINLKMNDDMNILRKRSEERVKFHPMFELIRKIAITVKKDDQNTATTLNLEKYQKEVIERREKLKFYEKLDKKIENLEIIITKEYKKKMEADTILAANYTNWKKVLESDVFLLEAISIMNDMK